MNGLQWWHVLIVVLVALLLFGGKRLPEAARGLGRSMRILKAEVGAMSDEKKDDSPDATAPTPTVVKPTALPTAGVQPIAPIEPIQPAQITINGRPVDSSGK